MWMPRICLFHCLWGYCATVAGISMDTQWTKNLFEVWQRKTRWWMLRQQQQQQPKPFSTNKIDQCLRHTGHWHSVSNTPIAVACSDAASSIHRLQKPKGPVLDPPLCKIEAYPGMSYPWNCWLYPQSVRFVREQHAACCGPGRNVLLCCCRWGFALRFWPFGINYKEHLNRTVWKLLGQKDLHIDDVDG